MGYHMKKAYDTLDFCNKKYDNIYISKGIERKDFKDEVIFFLKVWDNYTYFLVYFFALLVVGLFPM